MTSKSGTRGQFQSTDLKIKSAKIKKEFTVGLNGKRQEQVMKVGNGSIIVRFDKTPLPRAPNDVVCPHFLELKWANGCYFNCAWCYLQGTYRFHPEWKNGKPNIKDAELIKSHLESFMDSPSKPEILNAGELADSLLTENTKNPFSQLIADIFNENHTKHRVLFLTKSDKVQNVLKLNLQKYLVMSFTLNAFDISKRWEKGAPSTKKRIEAAKKVCDAGYEVRIRIDPMVPVDGWKEKYFELIDEMFSKIVPERITVGSLRGLQSTINQAKDKTWVPYMTEHSNWGKKIPLDERIEMYSALNDYLKNEHDFNGLALCKETLEAWEILGLNYKKMKCNCVT